MQKNDAFGVKRVIENEGYYLICEIWCENVSMLSLSSCCSLKIRN